MFFQGIKEVCKLIKNIHKHSKYKYVCIKYIYSIVLFSSVCYEFLTEYISLNISENKFTKYYINRNEKKKIII